MPTKYYSVYSHRYMISRNFTRKNKRKDNLGLLPVVRDLRNGAGDSASDHGNNRTRKDDSLCDILSSPSFRFVICLIIVMVVLLYKSVYMDYFHLKNEKSSISITKTSWNSTKTLYGYDDGKPTIEVIEILPNCGLQTICSDNAFPIHIYTGKNKTDFPRLCIMGKYVMSFNRTAGGRGINVAVIESTTYTIMDVKNFDTYEYNSSNLDEWLDHMVKVGDVVIFFTFDEASKKLTKNTRNVLYNMGSGKIQDLWYRCQWFMVTQKGIQGITPYEKITYSHKNNWADVLDEKLCVPFQITGNPIVSDDLSNHQLSFCNATFDEYTEYCNESNNEHTGSVNYGYTRIESRESHRSTPSRLLDRTE
ncbi:protein FAM3C-like [Metopolophium dirhodum]|uniref:protein FAM3C-like n=1 Tax=Metopolophium dirhodum TaxID=44670 RepID=UPI00298F8FAB|nr:protein FAM3C-like [Metopolophium dirhodum]